MLNKFKKKLFLIVMVFTTFLSANFGASIDIKAASATVSSGGYTGYNVDVSHPDGHYVWNDNYQTILIDGEIGFCIEPGYLLSEGTGFTPSPYVQYQLSIIAYEGWVTSSKTMEDYLATQFMIWEAVGGTIRSTSFTTYSSYKATIQNKINHHNDVPSFPTGPFEVNVGEQIKLKDSNNVLNKFHIASSNGLNVSINGSELVINGTVNAADNSKIVLEKFESKYIGTSLAYTKPGSQTVAKLMLWDPLKVNIDIKVNKFGSLAITKKDDLGNNVPDTSFKLSSNADMSSPVGTYTTASNGIVQVDDLLPGTYYIQETSVPAHLTLDSTIRSIVIKPNETTSYTANNNWKRGNIQVVKKDIDTGKTVVKANTTFSVYKSDNTFVQDITTNGNGIAKSSALLYGDYYLVEKTAPDGYIHSDQKLIYQVREDGKTYEAVLSNKRVLGTINVKKQDSVTGDKPQGEATLQGAVYELKARNPILDPADGSVKYVKDAIVATLTTDVNGSTSKTDLYLGDYYLKEKTPSDGYTLDPTEYDVTLSYANQNTSIITKNQTVNERVIAQSFELIKVSDNGSGEADLLAGVEFTVKAQKDIDQAGSWEKAPVAKNAQGKTAAILVTDKKGYAKGEELPYGSYVVRETKVPDDHYMIPDFKVVINKDSREPQVWRVFNDVKFRAVVSIVKKDADNDKIITLSGAKFKIKNLDKDEYVGHWVWNPLPHYVDSWTTDNNGAVMTDDVLDPGHYQLEEVEAPDGYLINEEPIKFKISMNGAFETLPDGTTPVITIIAKDKKPTGETKLIKSDKESSETLSGVQYRLTAAEDILDVADGSVLYEKGSPVSMDISEDGYYVTNELGEIEVEGLPLGSYTWKETRALDGYVQDMNEYTFELKQKDDIQKIYTHEQELTNQKTKVEILKQDVDNNALAGARMRLLDEDENIIKEWTSKKGSLKLEGLLVDEEYTLYEDEAPAGYMISKPVKFTVKNTNEVQEVKMIDNQVSALKTDVDEKALTGAKMQVVSTKTKNIVDEWTSTDKAHAISGLVEGQEYILREVKAPKGYVLASDITFTANDKKELQSISMLDKQVLVNKIDNEETSIKGASLQVIDKENNIIDSWISDGKEHAASNLKVGGEYILQEVEAPKGYVLAKDVKFTVTDKREVQKVVMVNKQVTALKIDEDGAVLPGAKMQVVSTKTKNIVDQWTSTDKAHAISGLVEGQEYILRELEAPEGLELADDIMFAVDSNKATQALEMSDKYILSTIQVNKVDSYTKEAIKSKQFAFTAYKDKDCKESLMTVNANTKDGTATFNLRYGEWWIKETEAPVGYLLSDEVKHVVINKEGVSVNGKMIEAKDFIHSFVYENQMMPAISTGDDKEINVSIGMLGFSGLIIGGVLYLYFKKDESAEDSERRS